MCTCTCPGGPCANAKERLKNEAAPHLIPSFSPPPPSPGHCDRSANTRARAPPPFLPRAAPPPSWRRGTARPLLRLSNARARAHAGYPRPPSAPFGPPRGATWRAESPWRQLRGATALRAGGTTLGPKGPPTIFFPSLTSVPLNTAARGSAAQPGARPRTRNRRRKSQCATPRTGPAPANKLYRGMICRWQQRSRRVNRAGHVLRSCSLEALAQRAPLLSLLAVGWRAKSLSSSQEPNRCLPVLRPCACARAGTWSRPLTASVNINCPLSARPLPSAQAGAPRPANPCSGRALREAVVSGRTLHARLPCQVSNQSCAKWGVISMGQLGLLLMHKNDALAPIEPAGPVCRMSATAREGPLQQHATI